MKKLLISVLIVVSLSFVSAGLLLSSGKTLGERHRPLAYPEYNFEDGDFQGYLLHEQARLRASRLDGTNDTIVVNAGPFILEPDPACARADDGRYLHGIVLTHGLFDSPYSMRDIGEFFQSRCYLVYGVLIPGHGSRPGDFLNAGWRDWWRVVHFATQSMSTLVQEVSLGGHSAGGALSILEALENQTVRGLFMFAPALSISEAAKFARFVTPVGQVFPAAAWLALEADEAVYRYESFTFSAAAEMHEMLMTLRARLSNQALDVPIFTVASMQDNTVGTQAILAFMASQTNPVNATLLYSQHELPDMQGVQVISSYLPEAKILSVSHLGLMVPPHHPHYGRNGVYKNCGHYLGRDAHKLLACKNGDSDFLAETTRENLQAGSVERIAFNPFYDDMLETLENFLQQINR
jgi:esterase/lipase